MKINTKKLTGIAMLCALSILSLYIVKFSLPIAIIPPFMEYDIADVFIFLGTFMYGPWAGLLMTAIVSLYQVLLLAGNGIAGFLMHVLSTGSYCVVAGTIYRHKRDLKGAIIALVSGFVVWIVVMIPANIIIRPLFDGTSMDVVITLLPAILLFNLIKAGVNSILTFLLYKRVHKLFGLIGVADRTTRKIVEIICPGVYFTSSEKETETLAKHFSTKLKAGDTVLLDGNLGAGKTVFARGIARGMGITEDIVSPTFNILKEYDSGKFCHFDMYRIEDEEELQNLGFEDYFGRDAICVVEWNRMPRIQGKVYEVKITNLNGKNRRKIEISVGAPK